MAQKRLLLYGIMSILFLISIFIYQKVTDDTYKGMTIIPEQQKDIPLYEGLEPTEYYYKIDGDHWSKVYEYYLEELPKQGWTVEYKDTALDDNDSENDWSGFYSRWRKPGFDGELSLSAHYNHSEDQTEVMFDNQQR